MPKWPGVGFGCSGLAIALHVVFLTGIPCLIFFRAVAAAEPEPGADAFCAMMMEHADQIWPFDQVQRCATWRKRQLDQLNKIARDCQAAHKTDLDHLDACDVVNDAATRFWEEAEYIEKNRDVPAEEANRLIRPQP